MSRQSTPESQEFDTQTRNQLMYQQRIQDEINNNTNLQIQTLTRYIEALELKLNAKDAVKVSNKAAFSLLAKQSHWDGNAERWVDFEVDVKAYLELSGYDDDLYRITWTMGYLTGPA